MEKTLNKTRLDSPEPADENKNPYRPFLGTWKVLESFFNDKVYIQTVRTKKGSFNKEMLIMYDVSRNGVFCSPAENSYFMCKYCPMKKIGFSSNALITDVIDSDHCTETLYSYFYLEGPLLTIYGILINSKEEYYVGSFMRLTDEP